MKKTNYPIHSDFKKWKNIHPPLFQPFLFFMQVFLRKLFRKQQSEPNMDVKKYKILSFDGENIDALLYTPKECKENSPCLIYYHGGGYVIPAASHHYKLAREYARQVNCKLLFVDYRLAPKYKFPVAPKDCFFAYQWVLEHTNQLKINKNKIGVAGDSAGGCLATVVCLMAKEKAIKLPCLQMLLYPATGVNQFSEASKTYVDTPMCNTQDMKKYQQLYLGNQKLENLIYYYYPILAENLIDLPPAYIETAEFDCLRDNGIFYAQQLKNFAVPVILNNTMGTIHGYDIELKSSIVQNNIKKRIAFLKEYFY